MCDLVLESLKTQGDIIIDGPLASNPCFRPRLRLRPRGRILKYETRGATAAICYLAGFPADKNLPLRIIPPIELGALELYRARWIAQLMH